jgi:peroxiredoxin
MTENGIGIGERAPDFELPNVDGESHLLGGTEGDSVTVVYWTCNHCPYALAWHDRLLEAARDYSDRGVRFLAINSNDHDRYPADSFEAMAERVEAEGDWPHPYLRDESQGVARAWGAQKTPHVFVLDRDRRLRYHGAPDADYDDASHAAAYIRDALDAVLEGRDPERSQTPAVGCGVKWRE